MWELLKQAMERGVEVKIALDQSYYQRAMKSVKDKIKELQCYNNFTFISGRSPSDSILHSTFCVTDNYAVFGSFNMSFEARTKHTETGMVTNNKANIQKFQQIFDDKIVPFDERV